MAITRWAPFSAFTSLEREMQDVLDRFELRPWSGDFAWKPSTDIFREGDELVVRAEIPGIDPDEGLTIEIEDNVLRITGDKSVEKEIEKEHLYLHECRFGSFRRDVLLPEGVDIDAITAHVDHGVLTVRIPAPAEQTVQPEIRRIAVETIGTDDTPNESHS